MSLVTSVSIVAPVRAAAAPPPYTLEERAAAIASPALVYVETVFTGYLRDKKTSTMLYASPVVYNRRCSGFVVNGDGHVVTIGLCVKPADDTVRQNALYSLGRILIQDKKLEAGELDNYVKNNLYQTIFTGLDAATPPDSQLFGQLGLANGARTDPPAIPGKIVKTTAPDSGNLAVIKLDQTNLPAVELSQAATLDQGATVVQVGYGTTDRDPRAGVYSTQYKATTVTGTGTRGEAQLYRTNGDVGFTSNGGMALDKDGRVVGVLDNDQATTDKAVRAIIQLPSITALLSDAGTTNTLSEGDRQHRAGLDAYFAGDYRTAITKFDAVLKSAPDNRVAQTYRQQAIDRQKIESKPASGRPGWLVPTAAAVGALLVAGIIALIVMLVRRARRRRATFRPFMPPSPVTSAPAYPMPVSTPPISGSPISGPPVSGGAGYGPAQPLADGAPPYPVSPAQPYPVPAQPYPVVSQPTSSGAPIYYPQPQPTSPAPNTGWSQYGSPTEPTLPLTAAQQSGPPQSADAWDRTQPVSPPQPAPPFPTPQSGPPFQPSPANQPEPVQSGPPFPTPQSGPLFQPEPVQPARPAYHVEPVPPQPAYHVEPVPPQPAYHVEPVPPQPAYHAEPVPPQPQPVPVIPGPGQPIPHDRRVWATMPTVLPSDDPEPAAARPGEPVWPASPDEEQDRPTPPGNPWAQ